MIVSMLSDKIYFRVPIVEDTDEALLELIKCGIITSQHDRSIQKLFISDGHHSTILPSFITNMGSVTSASINGIVVRVEDGFASYLWKLVHLDTTRISVTFSDLSMENIDIKYFTQGSYSPTVIKVPKDDFQQYVTSNHSIDEIMNMFKIYQCQL